MPIRLNPYLSFRDDARAAMEGYHAIFGGELTLTTFGEAQAADDPADADKIMHGMLETEDGLVLMGADTPSSMEWSPPAGISISLSGDAADEDRLRRCWEGLSDGGTPEVPLVTAPWGDTFGMLADRHGVRWMVNIAGAA